MSDRVQVLKDLVHLVHACVCSMAVCAVKGAITVGSERNNNLYRSKTQAPRNTNPLNENKTAPRLLTFSLESVTGKESYVCTFQSRTPTKPYAHKLWLTLMVQKPELY